jgi:hypothetical protein
MYDREFILHRNITQTDIWRSKELGTLMELDYHGGSIVSIDNFTRDKILNLREITAFNR